MQIRHLPAPKWRPASVLAPVEHALRAIELSSVLSLRRARLEPRHPVDFWTQGVPDVVVSATGLAAAGLAFVRRLLNEWAINMYCRMEDERFQHLRSFQLSSSKRFADCCLRSRVLKRQWACTQGFRSTASASLIDLAAPGFSWCCVLQVAPAWSAAQAIGSTERTVRGRGQRCRGTGSSGEDVLLACECPGESAPSPAPENRCIRAGEEERRTVVFHHANLQSQLA